MKKILKYTGISLLALIALAFVLPLIFKKQIVAKVKAEINNNLLAKVEFSDVSISLFRHFPKLSVGLENISVAGINEFRNDTLLSAKRADAALNLWSAISGDQMKLYGVYLNEPRIHAIINKDGKANWEIAKPDTATATEASAFDIKLDEYKITDGYIVYEDEVAGMKAEINGLDHEGSGDFTQDAFTLSTKTKATTASFNYGGIPYLADAQTSIDADLQIDNKTSKYTFKNAVATVNELKLNADGFFQLVNDSTYAMDISFDAPSNDFKNILSLVPAIYKNDFDKIKTSGTAAFKGFVKGTYSPQQLPAYDVTLNIKDGFFQYPDLPQPVKNIQVQAQFSNKDGQLDNTVVNVQQAHLEMGADPFDFRLLLQNPMTTKYIDAAVKGKLNFGDVGKFVKLEEGTKLSGLVHADAYAKGALSALQQGGGAFNAGGFFNIQGLNYAAKQLPQPLRNGNFKIQIDNTGGVADATTINVQQGHVEIGSDPIDFTLQLRQPVTAIVFNGTAKGRMNLANVQHFVQLEQGTALKGIINGDVSFSGSKADLDKGAYEKMNTQGLVTASNVSYVSKDYPEGIQVPAASLQFSPQAASLTNTRVQFMGTNLTASGSLQNMIGYALNKGELGGVLNLDADKINLNQWMKTDTATSAASSSGVFQVPPAMNITVNAKAEELVYDKVAYRNVSGTLLLRDETVRLQNVSTQALDGTVMMNGSYSTKANKQKPDISFAYSIAGVDAQKAFMAYNTVQKLMPVGQFLSGKITSQFSMTGKLGADMFPDLSSLTGSGNFLLIEGVLKKFAPVDKLASTLNVDALKDVSLRDIKSYFEFANGKVLVNPFNFKIKDIDLQVGGMHGFDQSLDYIIGLKVPRRYMGTAGNNLVNGLAAQATSRGIPVTLGDVVDLNVKMSGTVSNPSLKTDLKQTAGDVTKQLKQQATEFVQAKADSTKKRLADSLNVVKKQVLDDAKNEIIKGLTGKGDSTNKSNGLEGTKQKATETIKNTFGGLFKKKRAAGDSSGN
jgi:hypothetical protein